MANESDKSLGGWRKLVEVVPQEQRFSVLMSLVILIAGVAIVLAVTDELRLLGLIVIVVGLGWGVMIYQHIQNGRNRPEQQVYDITITVLNEGKPAQGASVTVIGPVALTDKKTGKDGRVVYKYTEWDQRNYRGRNAKFTATLGDLKAQMACELSAQPGQFLDLELQPPPTVAPEPSPNPSPQDTPGSDENRDQGEREMPLDSALYKRIVEFIEPYVRDERSRTTLINSAFWGQPVVSRIAFSNRSSSDFAAHLIEELDNYGGSAAIIRFLEALKESVGVDKQRIIDELIAALRA